MKPPSNLRGYVLERPLGKGGMGAVWVARKMSTHQEFAVKFLKEEFLEDPTYLARFEREVAALRAIRHPNVVNVFEWSMPKGDPEAKPYVVMELLGGEGLDRLIRRQRILRPQLAVSIMLQVLDGLAAAHNIGVIHRDLGPSNVQLIPQPGGGYLVKVLDFGLARPKVQGEEEAQVTQMGTLMGKPGYVAPETFLMQPADARADIFACGMMLYRMLSGRLPFRETQAQMLWAERYAEKNHDREYPSVREFAPWIPEKLALVTAKAIRRKPEERYQTAEDMQVDLLDIEDSVLAKAGQETPPPPSRSGEASSATVAPGSLTTIGRFAALRRWPVLGGIAAAVAVLAVVLLVWGLGGGKETSAAAPDASRVAAAALDAGDVLEAADPDDASAVADRVEAASPAPAPDVVEVVAAAPPADAVLSPAPDVTPTVLVVVAGAPEGAKIKVGDYVPEGNPPKVRVPYAESLLEVVVEAQGFEKYSEYLLPTTDRVVNVRMRPIRRPPPRRDAGSGGPAFPEFPEDL
ncbi:MAG: protein kinase [Myxococcales bacterium]|nr:protein kinase [Myxococcales bacterium]